MHKYRNALFITVSLLDMVYGGMGERDCERYPCPLGGTAGFGKIWAAEMRRCARHVTRTARKEVCASEDRDDVVPKVEKGGGRYKSQSPSRRTTTRRIGNKVKDIKSSATIRQSLFRGPFLVSRLVRVGIRAPHGRCLST